MNNEIPVSIIRKRNLYLLYFDAGLINNPEKVDSAYIVMDGDRIYPCGKSNFFEKKLCLSGCTNSLKSPWFLTVAANNITFFVYNNSENHITIHLENSPDAEEYIHDAHSLSVRPDETEAITPCKFSKYTRLAVDSDAGRINCTVWFQMQTI